MPRKLTCCRDSVPQSHQKRRCSFRLSLVCRTYTGIFFFSSRRRHTILQGDLSSDGCSSDLIHKVYDGGWFVGRPTLEELRQDLRRMISEERRVGKECRSRWSPDH